MNKLDSELVLERLIDAGYEEARDESEADVILFNTCSVRRHAEDRVYSRIGALRRMKARRPSLIIGVLGCMAQSEGRALIERSSVVDLICSPNRLKELPLLLQRVNGGEPMVATDSGRSASRGAVSIGPDRKGRARSAPWHAYVAVMTGCDNFCSYCVVPRLRGEEISRPPAEIVDEVRRLADDGCKEVTLLGQNVNSYGAGLTPRVTLADLLAMLNPVAGLERISFITSHPKDFTRELLTAVASLPKVCEYLHVPPQSGSDRILKLMNRGYTAAHYRELVAMAREIVPEVELAGDFIVGFPTETEDDFAQTLALLNDAEFINCFVFKYSPRPGTTADKRLADTIPDEVKQRRNVELLAVQERISDELNRAFLGREVTVLVEGLSKKAHVNPADSDSHPQLVARTSTDHIVVFHGPVSLTGRFAQVRITRTAPLTLFGERRERG